MRLAKGLGTGAIIGLVLFCSIQDFAQVVTNAPEKWIDEDFAFPEHVDSIHNAPGQEDALVDSDAVQKIGKSCGLSSNDLRTIQVANDALGGVQLYQIAQPNTAFSLLSQPLKS